MLLPAERARTPKGLENLEESGMFYTGTLLKIIATTERSTKSTSNLHTRPLPRFRTLRKLCYTPQTVETLGEPISNYSDHVGLNISDLGSLKLNFEGVWVNHHFQNLSSDSSSSSSSWMALNAPSSYSPHLIMSSLSTIWHQCTGDIRYRWAWPSLRTTLKDQSASEAAPIILET